MTDKPDPDKVGPGGISMRELHALVKQSAARDRVNVKASQALKPKTQRWQRFVRYVWDKKKGR